MEQNELLRFAAEALDRLGISYFVTGSFAGILYGEFRMTNDIDIVIELPREKVEEFVAAFPESQFYLDREAILDAIAHRFQFNMIDKGSLAKIDFIVSPNQSHDRETFRRRQRSSGGIGYEIAYAAPEDLLIRKMLFYKESESEKHLRDCVGILKRSRDRLDMAYLDNWADWTGVWEAWKLVRQLAEQSP